MAWLRSATARGATMLASRKRWLWAFGRISWRSWRTVNVVSVRVVMVDPPRGALGRSSRGDRPACSEHVTAAGGGGARRRARARSAPTGSARSEAPVRRPPVSRPADPARWRAMQRDRPRRRVARSARPPRRPPCRAQVRADRRRRAKDRAQVVERRVGRRRRVRAARQVPDRVGVEALETVPDLGQRQVLGLEPPDQPEPRQVLRRRTCSPGRSGPTAGSSPWAR